MTFRYADVIDGLRTSYDGTADERDSASRAKAEWRLAERAAFLGRVRAAGGRALVEIGAGTGQDSMFFKEQALDVIAIDLSPRMVEHCRAKGLDARVGDFLHLGLALESFDAVYTFNSLLHVPKADASSVLDGVGAVLRPGGHLFIGVWGGRSFEGPLPDDRVQPPRFFALRTDDELKRLVPRWAAIADFHTLPGNEPDFYFQSLTLRRSV